METERRPTPLRLLEVPQVADVQKVEHAVAVDDLPAGLAVPVEDGGQVFQAVDFLVVHHDGGIGCEERESRSASARSK